MYAGVSASFIWKICYGEMNVRLQIVHITEAWNRQVLSVALLFAMLLLR